MQVKLKRALFGPNQTLWSAGSTQDLSDEQCAELVGRGDAEYVGTPPSRDIAGDVVRVKNGQFTSTAAQAAVRGAVARGGSVAVLGDSLSFDNIYSTGTTPGWNDYGWLPWANAKAGGRGRFVLNAGVTGETSAQILARVQTVIDAAPDVCFVLAGKNDIINSIPSATTIANIKQIVDSLRGVGIRVLLCTVFAFQTGYAGQNLARSVLENEINNWIRYYASVTPGVYLVDMVVDMNNPTANPNATKAGYLRADNLHFSAQGARALGESSVHQALIDTLPPMNRLVCQATDSYGIDTGSTQMLRNPLFSGTGGTKINGAAGTVTGSVADSWQVEVRGSAATSVVASVQARGDGFGGNQRAVCTFAGATDSVSINSFDISSWVASGDRIHAVASLGLSSASNVKGIEMYLNIVMGGTTYFVKALARSDSTFSQSDFANYVFQTPEWVLSGAVTTCQLVYRVWSSAAGAATLDIGRASIRKITS